MKKIQLFLSLLVPQISFGNTQDYKDYYDDKSTYKLITIAGGDKIPTLRKEGDSHIYVEGKYLEKIKESLRKKREIKKQRRFISHGLIKMDAHSRRKFDHPSGMPAVRARTPLNKDDIVVITKVNVEEDSKSLGFAFVNPERRVIFLPPDLEEDKGKAERVKIALFSESTVGKNLADGRCRKVEKARAKICQKNASGPAYTLELIET